MPTVSFYLKNEDYAKWVALPHKGSFIHNALNQEFQETLTKEIQAGVGEVKKLMLGAVEKNLSGDLKGLDPLVKPIKTPAQARKALKPLTKGHVTYFKKGKI